MNEWHCMNTPSLTDAKRKGLQHVVVSLYSRTILVCYCRFYIRTAGFSRTEVKFKLLSKRGPDEALRSCDLKLRGLRSVLWLWGKNTLLWCHSYVKVLTKTYYVASPGGKLPTYPVKMHLCPGYTMVWFPTSLPQITAKKTEKTSILQ